MANPHACETFDFPLATGPVNYSVTKKISAKAGGTWQIAEQEAIDEARQKGDDDGKAALKNETCDAPCDCFIFVDVSIDKITPVWAAGKKGKGLYITVTGIWEAGILCFKHEEKAKDKKTGSGEKEKGKDKGGKKKKKAKDRKSAAGSKEKHKDKDNKSATKGKKKGKDKSTAGATAKRAATVRGRAKNKGNGDSKVDVKEKDEQA